MLRCFSRNSGTNFRRTFFEAAAILCIAVEPGSNLSSATRLQSGRLCPVLHIRLVVVRVYHFPFLLARAHEENWRAASDSGEAPVPCVVTSSYPRFCIRSPQADSIAATDSSARCDFHVPDFADLTKGLSLRVRLVRTQRLASCFSRARIRSGELSSMARCSVSGVESTFPNEHRSKKATTLVNSRAVSRFMS